MMQSTIRQTIRQRPWTTFWLGGGSVVVMAAAATEALSDLQEKTHLGTWTSLCLM
jgi:hypothetical protein